MLESDFSNFTESEDEYGIEKSAKALENNKLAKAIDKLNSVPLAQARAVSKPKY